MVPFCREQLQKPVALYSDTMPILRATGGPFMWILYLVLSGLLLIVLWRAIGKERLYCPICGHGLSEHRLENESDKPIGTYYCVRCKCICE